MTVIIVRVLEFLIRALNAYLNLGFVSAIKIFLLKNKIEFIKPKNFVNKIYFRSKGDYGSISHLYKEGYRIINNSNNKLNIVDLGANIGIETIRFKFFHPNSKIIAVEPEKKNFDILKLNCEFYNDIYLENKAIGNKLGEKYISNNTKNVKSQNFNESFFISDLPTSSSVELITMPWLIEKYNLKKIDILKCDIEGYERYLFDLNCLVWLSKVDCIIFECPDNDYNSAGTTQQMFDYFNKTNIKYNTYLCGENIILINQISSLKFNKITHF